MGSKKVGFIGLGSIGKPMANNILRKGFDLRVFDIRPEPMKELEAKGAKAAKNPKELSSQVDVVITMVPGPRETREVILGTNGIIEGLRPGSILIDMSTSSPALTKEMAHKLDEIGCKMIDAPVTRGIPDAVKGTLVIMAGGDPAVLDQCREVLECMASEILHIGPCGLGHAMKLVNNMISQTEVVSICGALALGTQAGIDLNKIFEVISRGTGNSFMFQYKAPRILRRDFEPGGSVDISYKDLDLATTMAQELGVPLLLPNTALEIYKEAKVAGLSKKDSTAIITLFEQHLGRKIGDPLPFLNPLKRPKGKGK
jgi:3-hydroxyisobutyrate dehydrogenase-like beta-hydroxyacid dehydrogenase